MVNSVDFGNRIKKIVDFYKLTASTFAEKIGVQRSSISHILSGRNKPSLDFVLKVTNHFSDVDIYWLLHGKGEFPKSKNTHEITTQKKSFSSTPSDVLKQQKVLDDRLTEKEIKRIVVFYDDGTFEEYKNQIDF